MKTIFRSTFWLLLAVPLLFSSCKKEEEKYEEPKANGVNLSTDATLGSILVDNNGNTLYFFTKDTNGASVCTDGCIDIWPVFYVENLEVGSGLLASDFGEITRTDGAMQTTYKGWPLYYYSPSQDGVLEATGETSGEGVNNVWFVAKPDYSIMLANAQLVGHDGKSYTSSYAEGDEETQYFVDGMGRTLYTFINDSEDYNAFTASDFSNNGVWPIYYTDLGSVPSTVNKDDFGSIMVYGELQLTYKGWPLYYYGDDTERGDNKGISFPSPGVWPIANTETTSAPAYSGETVKLFENETFGSILTDYRGRTLYFFTKDTDMTNHCTGGCESVWPVFYEEEIRLAEGSSLNAADFGEITLTGGSKQTTYKGWPLYYYSPTSDGVVETAGETGGDGVNNVWYVAKPSYSLMIADAQLVGHDGVSYTSEYVEGEEVTKYFVDGNGRTLYAFANDTKDNNNFTASDFSNNGVWPIFYTEIESLPSALNSVDFGEIDVFGQKQLTFKGRPLYYFGGNGSVDGDVNRGDNRGISFPSPGVWPIVNNTTSEAPASVNIESDETFGNILIDSKGRSLYFFTKDTDMTNHCTGGCESVWPVFYTDVVTLGDTDNLEMADFDEITLTGGSKQTTYKGWPLYYYSPTADGVVENAGETGGDGVNNVWYIAKPDYSLMIADAQLVGHDGVNYKSDYSAGDEVTKYFVDGYGRTIYSFVNDTKDDNNFTESDFSNNSVWPIYYVELDKLPSAMSESDFGEIDVFGQKQLTFKGHPLYYFGGNASVDGDTDRGDNRGISFPMPGVWPIVNNSTAEAE